MVQRVISGADVIGALTTSGSKVPAVAIPFGTASGTVAEGSAIATVTAAAAAAAAASQAATGTVAALSTQVTGLTTTVNTVQTSLSGYATNSSVTATVNGSISGLASTYVLQTALSGYPTFAQLSSAMSGLVSSTALTSTLTNYPTMAQMTAAITAAKLPVTLDATGIHWLQPDGSIKNIAFSSTTAAPGAVTPLTLASATTQIPGTFLSVDPALPASSAPVVSGTAGIQIDSTGDILALIEPIQKNQANAGYGRAKLVPGGPGGFPKFVSTYDGSDTHGYDALVFENRLAAAMAGMDKGTWGFIMVLKQTGTGSSGLMTIRGSGNTQILLSGLSGATDGSLRLEQNNGSAAANESPNANTVFGTVHALTVLCNGNNLQLFRNHTRTINTPTGIIGGFGTPSKFMFMNNAQAEVSLIECFLGNPSIAEHQARLNLIGARYGITIGTVTDGSTTHIAPGAFDSTGTFLTSPNFPISDNFPKITNDQPANGVTLASGASQYFSMIFGSSQANANILTDQQIRDWFYMNYIFGNQTDVLDPIGVAGTGDPPFYGRARHYAVGDPNDLHRIKPNGMNLRIIASNNGTNISNGGLYGAVARFGAEFRPGMTIEVWYKAPTNNRAWTPIWLISSVQHTPGAGGNPYTSGMIRFNGGGHAIEIDLNDMFNQPGNGIPAGRGLVFNSPLQNYGVPFAIPPHFAYPGGGSGASGGSAGYVFRGDASTPCLTSTVLDRSAEPGVKMLMNWRNDGSNLIDMFENGKMVQQLYLNYNDYADSYQDENGVTRQMALHMIFANQGPPRFEPQTANITTSEFTTDEHTLVIKSFKAWFGNVLNPESYKV